ncbi:riboflavin biosynthesis protein RibD, partial [Limosilactobacillus fermentum]|nr:riboflavin biosynthesis protein RibD [Limosilactobacillus fermentum]
MSSDEQFMQLALAEAAKGGSATWKNPQVGAVIVKDGQL